MNAKKLLNDAAKDIGLHAQVRSILTDEPLLEVMTISLLEYTGTESIAKSGIPLFNEAILQAVNAYMKAVENDQPQSARGSFIRLLLATSTEVFEQHIVVSTPNGDILWPPVVCGLPEFLAKYPGREITVHRRPSNISKAFETTFMMTKIIPHALLDNESLAELFDEAKLVI